MRMKIWKKQKKIKNPIFEFKKSKRYVSRLNFEATCSHCIYDKLLQRMPNSRLNQVAQIIHAINYLFTGPVINWRLTNKCINEVTVETSNRASIRFKIRFPSRFTITQENAWPRKLLPRQFQRITISVALSIKTFHCKIVIRYNCHLDIFFCHRNFILLFNSYTRKFIIYLYRKKNFILFYVIFIVSLMLYILENY